MLEFTLTATETPGNLAKGMRSPELAEQHRHELAPGSKPPGVPFGFGFLDHLLELPTRE
jgi:hypothetical protein